MADWAAIGQALGVGIQAAEKSLEAAGISEAQLVVNVAWTDEAGHQWCAGSRVPDDPHPLLAESLEASRDEVGS